MEKLSKTICFCLRIANYRLHAGSILKAEFACMILSLGSILHAGRSFRYSWTKRDGSGQSFSKVATWSCDAPGPPTPEPSGTQPSYLEPKSRRVSCTGGSIAAQLRAATHVWGRSVFIIAVYIFYFVISIFRLFFLWETASHHSDPCKAHWRHFYRKTFSEIVYQKNVDSFLNFG